MIFQKRLQFCFQIIYFIQIFILSRCLLITYQHIKNSVFFFKKCDFYYKYIRRIDWNSELLGWKYKFVTLLQRKQEFKLHLVLWDALGCDLMHEENLLWRDKEKLVLRVIVIYNCILCARITRQRQGQRLSVEWAKGKICLWP